MYKIEPLRIKTNLKTASRRHSYQGFLVGWRLTVDVPGPDHVLALLITLRRSWPRHSQLTLLEASPTQGSPSPLLVTFLSACCPVFASGAYYPLSFLEQTVSPKPTLQKCRRKGGLAAYESAFIGSLWPHLPRSRLVVAKMIDRDNVYSHVLF